MIYEAKVLGASAVLLICSILSEEQIKEYISICDELGLSALVEAHDECEVRMALNAGARMNWSQQSQSQRFLGGHR